MGYSGEVYLYLWARKKLKLKDSEILKPVKDNNIISSVASTLITILLLGIFVFTGEIKLLDWLHAQNKIYIYGGIILLIILILLTIRFRHLVISMPLKTAGMIFAIHFTRLLLGQTLQVLQWYIALPTIPFYVWFTFVSFQVVMSRIPFLPNNDLIFLGASIKMTQMMHVPLAGVAAIMVANSVLGKVANILIFSGMSFFNKKMAIPISTVKEGFDPVASGFTKSGEPIREREELPQND